jgi:hypothetical protein
MAEPALRDAGVVREGGAVSMRLKFRPDEATSGVEDLLTVGVQ